MVGRINQLESRDVRRQQAVVTAHRENAVRQVHRPGYERQVVLHPAVEMVAAAIQFALLAGEVVHVIVGVAHTGPDVQLHLVLVDGRQPVRLQRQHPRVRLPVLDSRRQVWLPCHARWYLPLRRTRHGRICTHTHT